MALLIRADGTRQEIAPAAGGAAFQLVELQTMVGGYIQAIPMDTGRYFVCNEDGKRLNLPVNDVATRILHAIGGMPDDFVVGDVLIATTAEMGGDDHDEDDDE